MTSPLNTFLKSLKKGTPFVTTGWFVLSAAVFVEVYIWSCSEEKGLGMIDRSKYERPRLNERPVFLRTMFLFTAVVASGLHLYYDRDRVPLLTTSAAPLAAKGLNTPLQLRDRAPVLLQRVATLTIILIPSGLVAYFLLLRGIAISCAMAWAQQFFRLSHSGTTGIPGLVSLIATCAGTVFLLLCFWELANTLYDIQISQAPLKRDQPLTADSKDANASLILGLRGRKEFAQNMAFWELVQIVNRFEARRRTIFTGEGMWTRISQACLNEIEAVRTRIETYNKPAEAPSAPPPQVQSLPKIGQPLKQDNIYAKSAPNSMLDGAIDAVGNFAKAQGNSPGGGPLTPRAKRLLEDAQGFLPQGQVKSSATGLVGDLLRSPAGFVFRQSFGRRATAVVCGSPLTRTSTIAAAVEAVTQLVEHSLKEDSYGVVSKDVLVIFKTVTGSLQAIGGFLRTLPVHWTDVDFKEKDRHDIEEVQEVQRALAKGLERLLLAYGEYLAALGASPKELRDAKALVGQLQPPKAMEMQQAR